MDADGDVYVVRPRGADPLVLPRRCLTERARRLVLDWTRSAGVLRTEHLR